MAAHSSILAWKIPWAEELAGLQFMDRTGKDFLNLNRHQIFFSDSLSLFH